jgi:hypothetical protein
MRAALGKRALRLVVSLETGGQLSFGSALLRNAVEFTPWEFGHLVFWQLFFFSSSQWSGLLSFVVRPPTASLDQGKEKPADGD